MAPCMPSPTRATRPHFTFSHSSPMLSYASTSHLRLKGYYAFSPIVKQKAPSVRASAFPMGGRAALQAFFEINAFLSSSDIDVQEESTFSLPSRPSVEDVAALKMEAMQLLRSGKGTEAVENSCIASIYKHSKEQIAIVHAMLDDKVAAKNWWEKFITIVEGGFDIPIA